MPGCVPSISAIRVGNLGCNPCTGKWPLCTDLPLPPVSDFLPLQLSPTYVFDFPAKLSFSDGYFKSPVYPGKASCRIPRSRDVDSFDICRELGLNGEEKQRIQHVRRQGAPPGTQQREELAENIATDCGKSGTERDASSFDFLTELNPSKMGLEQSVRKPKGDNFIRIEEGLESGNEKSIVGRRSGRQIMKRSNMIAKQVISIQSALRLGFVSELWVDVNAWVVMVVEVRPNLLSGELERCFLEDIAKVGDVLLIEDESVTENDFRLVGLETLVGYTVVTPGRRNIGKVRGYTFDPDSGAVESLELDSFGISIIPSSLVSTYALFVEDVLEVLSDTVVVHEAAASRIQRITKGFWGVQNMNDSIGEFEANNGGHGTQPDSTQRSKKSSTQNYRQKMVESSDGWELPMDYL